MLLFFAESCGRWGCTWQEGILTLLLMALFTTGPLIIILILAIVVLAIGSIILGVNSIYEKITYLMSSKETGEQKELEAQIEAKSINLAVNGIKQLVEWRQRSQIEDSQIKTEEKISSAVKPLGAIFNHTVQSIKKNKASQ